MIMTLRWFGKNFDSVTLKQIRQIPGVKGVITTLYDSKVGDAWKEEDVKAIKKEVEDAGLKIYGIESVNIHDDINEGGTNGDYNHQWGMGVWSDIRIAGKNIYGWRAPSEIFCTTCHEFGHAAHYTNATSTYKNSEERVIESWARFVQYILTRQEYVEMNALDSLYEKDTVGINNDVIMIKPDIEYNFQAVSVSSETVYTPLFIDLNDDYNQRDYYREAYYSSSTVAKATNDIIQINYL